VNPNGKKRLIRESFSVSLAIHQVADELLAIHTYQRRASSVLSSGFGYLKFGLLVLFVDLLGEIIFVTDFLDLMELTFDPIDVMFFVDDDMF